jgi:diaminopimelate epimerase
VVTIGTDMSAKTNWVILLPPRRVPDHMVSPAIRERISTCIDKINTISIDKVRQSDAIRFFSDQSALSMSGYLVFTGEPHLVIFSESGFDIPEIDGQLFLSGESPKSKLMVNEKRTSRSLAFVDFIGKYFVREFSDRFPVGINLNFVKITADGGSIEHRCFERGINHETLACGTGSLASAFVAKALNKIRADRIIVRPHRCRWSLPDAEITIEKDDDGWCLKGHPYHLFSGTFSLIH